ncbi:MAG: phosphatidylglycerophosphatase A [Pseudomonadota bacterium]
MIFFRKKTSPPSTQRNLIIVPTFNWALSSPHYFFAFGLGSGLSPQAPGTMGSLAAIPLFWLSGIWALPVLLQCLVLAVIFVYGCYACHVTGKALGEPDHGSIVIDEVWAMWVLLCFFPTNFLTQLYIFAAFRLFDITKPHPIRMLEKKFKNGFGVMIDDGLAAFYAFLLLKLLVFLKVITLG